MTPTETVQNFLSALESLDIEGALALAAPDIVYQNLPLPPARGVAAFAKQMRMFARLADRFEAKIHHIAANGPVVLTERTDVLGRRGAYAKIRVFGTFEVRDGKIVAWRDSFDWAALSLQTLLMIPRALVGAVTRRSAAQA